MALKVLTISLLIALNLTFGAENNISNDQKVAKLLSSLRIMLDKGKYEEVEEFYDKMEDALSGKSEAMEYLALSYEKRLKYANALKIYSDLLKKDYSTELELISKLKDNTFLPPEKQSEKLKYYLYKQVLLNILIYQSTNTFTSPEEITQRKKALRNSVIQAGKAKVEKNDLQNLVEKLDEKIKGDNSYKYKTQFYLTSQIVSWQQNLDLNKLSTNEKYQILATNFGQCAGGGVSWINAYHEFDIEGCFGKASSTVSSQSQVLTYQQTNINISFIQFEPGFYTKYFSNFVLIGVHLPIFYSKGEWQEPNSDFLFKDKKQINLGYHLTAKVKIKNFDLVTKLGKIFTFPSSHWLFGLNYNF